MSLRSVNLNLVPVLRSLLRSASVSQAAEALGLSQGAASNALSRLRAIFGDPLLVRVGARMELTPRAADLLAPVEELHAQLEGFFSRPRFDPATVERTFVIATSDYTTFLMAGPLLAAIEPIAPKVRLRFIDVLDRLKERMSEREIDIAIMPEPVLELMAPTRFNSVRLLSDEAVAVFRSGHPLASKKAVGETDLAPYRSIAFHPGSERLERSDPYAFMGGHEWDVAAFIPHVATGPYLMLDTNYFTISPGRIARRLATLLPLETRPLTFAAKPLHIALAWSPVHDNDLAHIWLRSVIFEATVGSAF